jgi:hypothetical protein
MTAPLTSAEAERRIAEIARGLTKAQREAVLHGKCAGPYRSLCACGSAEALNMVTDDPPLFEPSGGLVRGIIRTPLGLAVRAHLTQESNR